MWGETILTREHNTHNATINILNSTHPYPSQIMKQNPQITTISSSKAIY